jgi:hypothetical protein
MTISLAVLAIFIARGSRGPIPGFPATDPTMVNMFAIEGSLEEWADGHGGAFPYAAEFDSDSSPFMKFLARDREG